MAAMMHGRMPWRQVLHANWQSQRPGGLWQVSCSFTSGKRRMTVKGYFAADALHMLAAQDGERFCCMRAQTDVHVLKQPHPLSACVLAQRLEVSLAQQGPHAPADDIHS